MKLVWKLAIPQICIVVGLGLISYVVIIASFNNMREQYVSDAVHARFSRITKDIEANAREAARQTSLFVRLPAVMRAYETALGGNIDDAYSPQSQAAREQLRKELAPMLDSYREQFGNRLQLHFHLPNARSLVRLWRDKNTRIMGEGLDVSDDLVAFRPTVVEVNKTGKPVMGIELGSGGFAVRGVLPVKAPDGRQLGSAEVLQDFQPILDTVREAGKIELILYVNKERISIASDPRNPAAIATDLQDSRKNPHKGDFVRVTTPKDGTIDSLITPELLSRGKSGSVFEHHGTTALATLPINDYLGTQLGILVCAMNTEDVARFADTAARVLALILAGMAIATTCALLLLLRMLVSRPLTLVKTKIQDIAEDRADLSEQIPSRQNDEIGELAKWFNSLTAKLDGILRERQAMLNEINKKSDESEAMAHWYESILDAIPFLISVQDSDMKWTFINKTFEKILGKTREDVIGLPCRDWGISICGTDKCSIDCAKRGLSQTHFFHESASYQVEVTVLKDLHGEITGFIEVIQDITKLEQLAQQQAEAKSASQAKSDFLSNMSHEIRTPLNAIVGMTSIGMSSGAPERMKYCLTKIEDASKHLLGVINDILDMSKIEAGKLELSLEEFTFENMLQRVVNVVKFRADEKQQTLTVHIDKDIPKSVVGDDQRLAQVVTNLIGNAVKFSPENGSINVDTRFLGEENGVCTVQIAIHDTGIGLSLEQQAKLFQSFQQAESDTARKFGGTGLGLAISRSIVEMMGGRIWIESELGKGATFAFTVQLRKGTEKNKGLSKQGINWTNVRILVVDDDPGILEYFDEIMHGFGASCDIAGNPEEALRLVEENGSYNIYFIDWKMQDIDGIKLTQDLKAKEAAAGGSVVVLISAFDWSAIADEARAAGVDKYIQKPLFPSYIADTISEYLGVGRRQAEGDRQNPADIFEGRRILLAEDVEINREIVQTLLEPTRLQIDCAENGSAAVRMFSQSPDAYDIIFMDVQMPEMDGYEATRAIRALNVPKARTIPIIAMTANVFREDVEKCIASGMNAHVGKPLDFDEVIVQLRQYLRPGNDYRQT